ncbi:DUF192 domain-containing protein [Pelotomaculum isophthalicicum JI]|uniref:DUF192 domain-containing protein n=1 Tax=Pelotomaculum isophthalicicum JI TaxID=947010 RepID=A0A9X4H023_9FIRM|nr:DUF192 domain-containing protein [Pelotomaculum isophthalicicum]MDF9406921.1 DUF192 domain-containing protein [Pelotomaculum isophthalicicum JI]
MQLVNLSNGTVLADRVWLADNFKKRLKGLIGNPGLKHGEALILSPCKSIHTCFMSFNIDVIFASKEMTILHTIENIGPFRFSPLITRSHMVIELPVGHLAATGSKAGHQLQLTFKEAVL